ncbi:MAG: phosphoribosylglycinamide formyltransferase [Gammaproteobacteria bacterium]|nr:phosphoribosylglycinamide formyltransferase [Gammaproteobacteria bacterium]
MSHRLSGSINLVVLISGSGSNLQSIIDHIKSGELNATISAVISNVVDVKGLQRAIDNDIPAITLPHTDFPDREIFDAKLQSVIESYQPNLVILAGFMRILSKEIAKHFRGRMLNIHPSLLPKYPGLHTHQRALDAKDSEHGTSIHFVTEELDGGPLIYQKCFPIEEDDTADSLFQKVQKLEHQMYPEVISWFSEGKLKFVDGTVWLDEELK